MKGRVVCLALACALSVTGLAQRALVRSVVHAHVASPGGEIIAGQILVKYDPDRAAALQAQFSQTGQPVEQNNSYGEKFVSRIGNSGWTLWTVPLILQTKTLAQHLMQTDPSVICAQPVHKIYPLTLTHPNDPDYSYIETDPNLIITSDGSGGSFQRMWNLQDIDAFNGWSVYPGMWLTATRQPGKRPIVAIIDTGVDSVHPDFINAGGTGTDVSQGGQLMKSASHQFHLGQMDPNGSIDDTNGHGTHVAGICLAAGNNGPFSKTANNGVVGVGYNARAMILRVFDSSGNGSDADAAAAMYWAADHGADIISMSLGTTSFSQLFQDATTYAFQKGCCVFAAGNESSNGGGNLGPIYPAACSGAFAVTAAGPGGIPAQNYAGTGNYIQVAAPGGEVVTAPDFSSVTIQYVWSTAMETQGDLYAQTHATGTPPYYDLNYAYLVGTSMACPHVSGAAALYEGRFALSQTYGFANVMTYRAIALSAQSNLGAPNGTWEPTQGYGELDVHQLVLGANTRSATVGSIDGILYYNGTPVANVAVKAKIGPTTFSTTTAADGTYRFDQLPPGIAGMSAAPFGAVKLKKAIVRAGSDTPGVDFWCGTYTADKTPPVIYRLVPYGAHTATRLNLYFWAYDTETGVDKVMLKVGTTAGAQDVWPNQEVLTDNGRFSLPMNIPLGKTYYVTVTCTNGAGLTSAKTISFVW